MKNFKSILYVPWHVLQIGLSCLSANVSLQLKQVVPWTHISFFFFFLLSPDGFVACGCLGDSDQWVSIAGLFLFRSPRVVIWLAGIWFYGCICCIYYIPYIAGHYVFELVWFFTNQEDHKHRELINGSQTPVSNLGYRSLLTEGC